MKSFLLIVSLFVVFVSSALRAQSFPSDSIVTDVSNASLNQDNPSVSINRKNKNLILIGAASDYADMDANGMLAYTSTDKGATWSSSRLPLPLKLPAPLNKIPSIVGGASVTSDDAGNFYYAYLTYLDYLGDTTGNISIATSTDGKVWNNTTPINNNIINKGFPDNANITVDNSPASPHHGRIYVVWNQFFLSDTTTQQGVTICWSDNKGSSWSTPKLLGPSDDYQICKTGKNGEIYVFSSDSAGFGHEFFVSTDGGSTFTSPPLSFGFHNYPAFLYGPDSGFTVLKGSQGFAAFPYTAFDVDLNTGRIHAVYGEYQGNVAIQNYSFSDDKGLNWSPSQYIGISAQDSFDRFDPCVSVDQKTEKVNLLYYSSESDPKNITVAPYRLQLTDPLNYQPQILSLAFDPLIVEKTSTTSPYIGDHTMSDAFDSVYVATWTQNRPGFIDGDVFAYVSYPKSAKNSVQMPVVIHSSKSWLSLPYPNPSDGKNIYLSYYMPHATHLTLDLFDASGKQIKHLADRSLSDEGTFIEEFSLSNLASGSYIIRMITDEGQVSQKLIIIDK